MTFHVGQKVVCVDDKPRLGLGGKWRKTTPVNVRCGAVYTVTGFRVARSGRLAIYVAETQSIAPPLSNGQRRGFLADRFRPVTERKTDISIFTRMLTDKRATERV